MIRRRYQFSTRMNYSALTGRRTRFTSVREASIFGRIGGHNQNCNSSAMPRFLSGPTMPPGKPDKDDALEENKMRFRRFVKNWSEQLKAPPNVITSMRILSTPFLCYLVVTGQYDSCVVGCCIAGASDFLDGWLARNYNMSTVLGSYLDPAADKVIINSLAISLVYVEVLPMPLVALWVARDVGLMVGTYLYVRSNTREGKWVIDPGTTPLKVEPTAMSKINTGLQFLTLCVALVQPSGAFLLESCCWVTGVSTVVSTMGYIGPYAFSGSGNQTKV